MISTKNTIPEIVTEKVSFLGEEHTFELNHYAYKADAALTVRKGETVVLATVSVDKKDLDGNFVPLSVEYIEKFYAGGIISSSRFVKREMRPSDAATLKARQIDHAVRSLFPKSWRKPVSLVITVLAYDHVNDPEQLSVIAASAALMISSVPFFGPSASIKVLMNDAGELVWGPKEVDEENSKMDMVVSLVNDRILNIEGWGEEIEDSIFDKIMDGAVEKCAPILEFQKELAAKHGRTKQEFAEKPAPEEIINTVKSDYQDKIRGALEDRENRQVMINEIKSELSAKFESASSNEIDEAVEYIARKVMRDMVLTENKRTSGRELKEIRPLRVEVGVLPRVHGSGVFTRGVTQSLSVLTLGSARLAQNLESFEGEEVKRWMHHYSSPNYSYGDAGRFSYYPGRREIGHGNIGENALKKMLPSEKEFPYTIRVSSEIMSSNGSTSMAATCAACLALLDGGVPLKGMVAGVAVGLVTGDDNVMDYRLLTDMEDVEDFYGDMDFKVTGSEKGVTAIQLDNKLKGVPVAILKEAFKQSLEARLEILAEMRKVIDAPRSELSPNAPKIVSIKIDPEKIGELIGPGGKVIRGIIESCDNKVEIDIEDDGTVNVMAVNEEYRVKALDYIKEAIGDAEIGGTYTGVVGKVADYGVFVDVSASISGLVHVTELSDKFVKNVADEYNVGDKVRVKILEKDNQGRLRLSIKQADTN